LLASIRSPRLASTAGLVETVYGRNPVFAAVFVAAFAEPATSMRPAANKTPANQVPFLDIYKLLPGTSDRACSPDVLCNAGDKARRNAARALPLTKLLDKGYSLVKARFHA
jgi:hypothetical protein